MNLMKDLFPTGDEEILNQEIDLDILFSSWYANELC